MPRWRSFGFTSRGSSGTGSDTPEYLKGLVGDLAERTERTSFTRPRDYDTLRSIYDKSQGTAPDLLSGVGSSAIAALFTEAIRASQQMARERGGARAGERGVAPGAARTTGLSSGVQAQQLASAMRPLQERIAKFQLMDALELARAKREATEKGLAALFAAASGPISEDRYTSYKTRPARDTMPEVRYPSQSMGAGSISGSGVASSSDDWWGRQDAREREDRERADRDMMRDRQRREGPGGPGSSGPVIWPDRDDPPGGGPSPLPGSLSDLWPSPDEPPGGGPSPLPGGSEEDDSGYEYTMGGTGGTQFRARRRKGETGSYARF